MTTVLDNDATVADVPPRRRRIWPRLLLAVVVLALVGAGIGWLGYIHSYQPLSGNVSGGFGPATRSVAEVTDGIEDTNYVLVGPIGTTGVVNYSIGNTGRFPIRILGLSRNGSYGVSGVRWANESLHNPGNGATLGLVSESHSFPMTLQSNETIFLQVSVRKFRCADGNGPSVGSVALRWSALGVHHQWTLDLTGATLTASGSNLPIILCPTKAALAHIDPR